MKYLKIFIALTFFSFVFIQCQKEMTGDAANSLSVQKQEITMNTNSDNVQKSVTNNGCEYDGGDDCDEDNVDTFKITPFFPDYLVVGGVVYNIPPGLVESGCEVGGYFTFDICSGNVINVTEYIFFITPECETLNDYLNGLPQDEYEVIFNYLSDLVQDMGTQYLAQKYSNTFPDDSYVNINWWQPVCYKTCYECVVETNDGGPVPDFGLQISSSDNTERNDDLELRGGGGDGVRDEPCSKG